MRLQAKFLTLLLGCVFAQPVPRRHAFKSSWSASLLPEGGKAPSPLDVYKDEAAAATLQAKADEEKVKLLAAKAEGNDPVALEHMKRATFYQAQLSGLEKNFFQEHKIKDVTTLTRPEVKQLLMRRFRDKPVKTPHSRLNPL